MPAEHRSRLVLRPASVLRADSADELATLLRVFASVDGLRDVVPECEAASCGGGSVAMAVLQRFGAVRVLGTDSQTDSNLSICRQWLKTTPQEEEVGQERSSVAAATCIPGDADGPTATRMVTEWALRELGSKTILVALAPRAVDATAVAEAVLATRRVLVYKLEGLLANGRFIALYSPSVSVDDAGVLRKRLDEVACALKAWSQGLGSGHKAAFYDWESKLWVSIKGWRCSGSPPTDQKRQGEAPAPVPQHPQTEVRAAAPPVCESVLEQAEGWVEHVRACGIPGPCVLDMHERNTKQYCCGHWWLFERDLRLALPGDVAEKVCCAVSSLGALAALRQRRELCNFKKLLLHMLGAARAVERDHTQLTTVVYNEDDVGEHNAMLNGHSQRYFCLSQALQETRGLGVSLHDARQIAKAICCVDRHPDGPPPSAGGPLHDLPNSTRLAHLIGNRSGDGPCPDLPNPLAEWDAALQCLSSEALGVPPHVVRFVLQTLIARGIAKALIMRGWLRRYCLSVEPLLPIASQRLEDAHAAFLRDQQRSRDLGERAMMYNRLRGAVPAYVEIVDWFGRILSADETTPSMFVAGDSAGDSTETVVTPNGFKAASEALSRLRSLAKKERGPLVAKFAEPEQLQREVAHLQGPVQCSSCARGFARLWVHRGVCWVCEVRSREAGRCPFSAKCTDRTWCPHSSRCFMCDHWSCDQCRFHRGDGDYVSSLVEGTGAKLVCLDFDRTLSTTKAGGSPLQGSHDADQALCGILATHPNVHIVTKNSHASEIAQFLSDRASVPQESVRVHSVPGRKKSEVVLRLLEESGGCAVFADDDVKEHLDPALVSAEAVHRVLFVRAL
eukprot:TRINITY_DN13520_c0_g1_i1.p1 TRINITY_DN13520_c0_g1~~TRINITY_DN13520_c0_g1_i1.p1  ORF type:complete len:846 (+),score=173.85 TRINITY_DN13520_c0_g1_i1:316-2853(+)